MASPHFAKGAAIAKADSINRMIFEKSMASTDSNFNKIQASVNRYI